MTGTYSRWSHRAVVVLLASILALLVGSTAHAQDGGLPLSPLVIADGDIYLWDGGLPQPITNSGYAFDPVVAPNGDRLAFTEYAEITLDVLREEGGLGGGALPNEIVVYEYITRELIYLTEQPPGASLDDFDTETVARSAPAWSPDGEFLTWTELVYAPEGITYYLVVYDVIGRAGSRIATLPEQYGVPNPPPVLWSEVGLVVWSITLRDGFADDLLVYNAAGAQVASIFVPALGDDFIDDFLVLEYEGQPYIGAIYTSADVALFAPSTGDDPLLPPGVLDLYSPIAPRGLDALVYQPGGDGTPFFAEIAGGDPVDIGFSVNNIALAPEGTRAAVLVEGEILILNQQGVETNALAAPGTGFITGIAWGPVAWRIRETLPPPSSEGAPGGTGGGTGGGSGGGAGIPPELAPCGLAPQFEVGDEGFVLPGPANRVRALPTLDGIVLGQIPGEGFFIVLEGPVCADGFIWWRVQSGDLVGWTAEGTSGEYFLAPLP